MKKQILGLCVGAALLGGAPGAWCQQHEAATTAPAGSQSEGGRWVAGLKYEPIKWQVPAVGRDVERYELDNGLVVYLKEDRTLPEFRIQALIRCGSLYDAPEQSGLSALVGTVMRTGGTRSLSSDSLNSVLEFLAASIETSIGSESGSASLYCLSKDIETGIQLFADVLRNPAFSQEKLDLAKEQIRKGIKGRNDQPGAIASREFDHVIYGTHPWGRLLEWETVKPLRREDLVAYHEHAFAPNRAMLGVTGDFDTDRVKKLLKSAFGDWKPSSEPLPSRPKVAPDFKPGVYFIERNVNQSAIRFGHLGIDNNNPDRYAVSVMNFILGGAGFNSRMTSRVRSDEGLAYSVGTRFETGANDLGTFYAFCQTKSSSTLKALQLMKAEVERIREAPVSGEELAMAKDSYVNRYIFQFTSASQIVGQLMALEYDDRPRDLLEVYLDRIRAVTAEDVQRVAQEYLHPDKISYLVVGKKAQLDGDLATLGQVTQIELKDPVVD